jgi:hypothetical protein
VRMRGKQGHQPIRMLPESGSNQRPCVERANCCDPIARRECTRGQPPDRERNVRILAPGCGETDLRGVRARGQTSRGNRCPCACRGKKAFH